MLPACALPSKRRRHVAASAGRYGDRKMTASSSLLASWRTIRLSRTLLTLGLVNACYETALNVFVFMWTPSLERRASHQMSHGLVPSASPYTERWVPCA